MYKKRLVISVLAIICLAVAVLLFCRKFPNQEDGSGMMLPEITAIAYDGHLFELDKLEKVKKTVVFFFSPECDHCEEEIKYILDKRSQFEDKNIRWIFITMDILKDELSVFLESYPINTMLNTYVLLDNSLYYHNLFEAPGSPSVYIFDKSERLVHKINGGFNSNILTQWL